jgi:hypothetical protein
LHCGGIDPVFLLQSAEAPARLRVKNIYDVDAIQEIATEVTHLLRRVENRDTPESMTVGLERIRQFCGRVGPGPPENFINQQNKPGPSYRFRLKPPQEETKIVGVTRCVGHVASPLEKLPPYVGDVGRMMPRIKILGPHGVNNKYREARKIT